MTTVIDAASALTRTLLQASWLGLMPVTQSPVRDSATVCLVDAATHAPVIGVELRVEPAPPNANGHPDGPIAAAVVIRTRSACVTVPMGNVRARRVGYREVRRHVSTTPDSVGSSANARHEAIVIALTPVAIGMASMDTVRVNAPALGSEAQAIGRMSATVSANAARARGAANTNQPIALLPLTQVRSARGETGVSLRGARREQVVMTLDGLPLNDPATGTADVSDLPLASIGSATVTLGADPLNAGPGAGGGVIAITTGAQRVVSLRAGSFGQVSAEGAWAGQVGGALLHASALWRTADNDFPFDNTAGATDVSQREHRVNNDEARTSVNIGAIANAWQVALMASRADRGMVGPANVRTYDADRSRTDRLLVRAQLATHGTQLLAGARQFTLGYCDPTRPPLDYDARVQAADVEWRGQQAVPAARAMLVWRLGGGADAVRATGGLVQDRRRAFAMSQAVWNHDSWRADFGLRLDAIEGAGTQPSLALAAERDIGKGWSVSARAAQAVRAPTLYDLYFTSPQRITMAALRPEHITADAEVASHWRGTTPLGRTVLDVSLVARRTSDAIVWFPGNFTWTPANVGREDLHGAEARLRVTPSWGEWSLWSTVYDPVLLTGGLRIPTPYVARLSGGSQWLVQHHRMSFSLITRSMGRRPYTAGPRDPLYELSAVTLVDLAVTHNLPRALAMPRIESRVTWSVENATDAEWQSVRGFPSPGRTWALAIVLRPLKPS